MIGIMSGFTVPVRRRRPKTADRNSRFVERIFLNLAALFLGNLNLGYGDVDCTNPRFGFADQLVGVGVLADMLVVVPFAVRVQEAVAFPQFSLLWLVGFGPVADGMRRKQIAVILNDVSLSRRVKVIDFKRAAIFLVDH